MSCANLESEPSQAQLLWDSIPGAEKLRLQIFFQNPQLYEPDPFAEIAPAIIDAPGTQTVNEDNVYDICQCQHFRYSHVGGADTHCSKCMCIEFRKREE